MKKAMFSTLIMVTVAITLMACGGGKSGKTLVSVGSGKITEGDINMLTTINPRIQKEMATEFGKRKLLDNLVEQELFYQGAIKDDIQKKPAVKDKIELYRKVVISQAYMDEKFTEAARKYYDEHKAEFAKLKLSDIQIKFGADEKDKNSRGKKEALDLINKIKARLTGGEDFAKVAGETSEDAGSKGHGGDMGLVSKDDPRLVSRGMEALLEKAFTMKAGETAGPIEAKDGYYMITVTQESELQPFESALQGILFKIRTDVKNLMFADLKKRFKVEYASDAKAKEPKAEKPAPTPAPEAAAGTPEAVPQPVPAEDKP